MFLVHLRLPPFLEGSLPLLTRLCHSLLPGQPQSFLTAPPKLFRTPVFRVHSAPAPVALWHFGPHFQVLQFQPVAVPDAELFPAGYGGDHLLFYRSLHLIAFPEQTGDEFRRPLTVEQQFPLNCLCALQLNLVLHDPVTRAFFSDLDAPHIVDQMEMAVILTSVVHVPCGCPEPGVEKIGGHHYDQFSLALSCLL